MAKIKNFHLLKTLSLCKPCIRKKLIQSCSKETIHSICEIVDNLLNNKIPISQEVKQKLSKFKCPLRKLVKRSSLKDKKKILNQKGSFLQFIIPAVITALGSIISDAINKHD